MRGNRGLQRQRGNERDNEMTIDTDTLEANAPGAGTDAIGYGVVIPFVQHLGIELIEQGRERAVVRLARKPELLNSWGTTHGGVIMTMMDLVMCCAVRGWYGTQSAVLTVDMSVGFLNASDGVLTAEGRVLNAGRSTVFCESEARAEDGRLLAKSIGTFKLVADRKA